MTTRNMTVIPTIDLRTEEEKRNEDVGYKSVTAAELRGKRSGYARAVGGFSIYKMSNGNYNWFPNGHKPTISGELDRGAKLISKWHHSNGKWKRIM